MRMMLAYPADAVQILYIEDGTAPRWQGIMWAALLALSSLLGSLFNSQYTYAVRRTSFIDHVVAVVL